MITKAEVLSVDLIGNTCLVSMPLFQNASSASAVTANALINITPGLFNNIFVGDIVFVGFEENALEKPIILGKLYRGMAQENETLGGAGILNSLRVNQAAELPAAETHFKYSEDTVNASEYVKILDTPLGMAVYSIKLRTDLNGLDTRHNNTRRWIKTTLAPNKIVIDDGDLDKPEDYSNFGNNMDGIV